MFIHMVACPLNEGMGTDTEKKGGRSLIYLSLHIPAADAASHSWQGAKAGYSADRWPVHRASIKKTSACDSLCA